MSSVADIPSPHHRHPTWLYVTIIVVLVALAVWGVIAYRGHKQTQQATALAQQLQQSFEQAGLPVFASTDQISGVLGTDGGAVCTDSGKDLTDAFLKLQLSNGAGGPGQRPVLVDSEMLKGGLLIVQTYCPDKLQSYEDFLNKLKTKDVIKQ